MTIPEVSSMAAAVAKSRLFPGLETTEQAFALMMICNAEGLHPMKALARYHIIKGRPTWKSSALLSAFKERGGHVCFTERTATKVEAVFEKDGEKQIITWTIEMAKAAGLATKDVWISYPRQMLTARVISEGVGLMDPGILGGMNTEEIERDLPDNDEGNTRRRRIRAANEIAPQMQLEEPQAQAPSAVEDERQQLLDAVMEAIDSAQDIVTLDEVVKGTHKITILGMEEGHRKMAEDAYKTKKKLLMFGSVPGTQVTSESSTQVMVSHETAIRNATTFEELDKAIEAVRKTEAQMLPEHLDLLSAIYKEKHAFITPSAKKEEKAPASGCPIPETTVSEPAETKPGIFDPIDHNAKLPEDHGKASQEKRHNEELEKQAKAKPQPQEPPTAEAPKDPAKSKEILERIINSADGAKNRAMCDAIMKALDAEAAGMTQADYDMAKHYIQNTKDAISATVPKSETKPKKLEQTCIPGMEPPKKEPIKSFYGANDQVPEWVKVGADVEVSALPGSKPYCTTTITGPAFLEPVTKQLCVKTIGVAYPVPVACLKLKEAEK